MLDPLSDVLGTLRMRGTLWFRTDLRPPWGVRVRTEPGAARFHVLLSGECWIEVDGGQVRLERGDLLIVPHGARHCLRDQPDRPTVELDDVIEALGFDGSTELVVGEQGPSTVLVCGEFTFGDERLHPVLDALPAAIHVRAADGHDFSWLDAATRTLAAETAARPPGWEAVIARTTEILFIQALRSAMHSGTAGSVVAAFADPQLLRALTAIHEDPAHGWTLDELGRIAGMSRTVFAHRFRERMGMPPITYLTRWRLQRARRELLDGDDIVASVADQVGYRSEAAFCRAFQRFYGTPPATYRREHARG